MLLLNRYGLEQLVWCMIPGLLVALLVAKANSPQPTKEESVTTTAFSHTESKKTELWSALRPELRPLIVLYLITTLRNRHDSWGVEFPIIAPRSTRFFKYRAFGGAFPLCIGGFNRHHHWRLPFRSD